MSKRLTRAGMVPILIGASLFAAQSATAQTPGGLDDLIGARGSSAEMDLQRRGYTSSGNNGGAALWWNSARKSCVSVYVDDGRVQSIQPATAKNCGKKNGDGGAVAAVAIGAILAGAIIAGSSGDKHHDHDDGYYGRSKHSYSPEDGVTCYRRESACYKHGDFSAKWTRREF